jgi:RNA polymerase sigma-54 factor
MKAEGTIAWQIVSDHLALVENRQYKEIARLLKITVEEVNAAIAVVRKLDPFPGQRYNKIQPRLIEPDVFIVKSGEDFTVVVNEDDLPQIRLNPSYRRLLEPGSSSRDVRNYVKERYSAAMRLLKNIEQRKQTIVRVCQAVIRRQRDFLDYGVDYLKPMMIKEVAEEVGVHPSTVSRAVASKYAHTPQGVFELRYFFSEAVNGPSGGAMPLLILKRKVNKLIEQEDKTNPLTDDQIAHILCQQGITVNRRTVAKYRADMKIPSTHQRRVKT